MKAMVIRRGISLGLLALPLAWGCSGRTTASDAASAGSGTIAGGGGYGASGERAVGRAQGGATSAGGSSASGGTASGGVAGGEFGCPAVLYLSGVTIQADWIPPPEGLAQSIAQVCRNDECYEAKFGSGNTAVIDPMTRDLFIEVSVDQWLTFSWTTPGYSSAFKDGDRYRVLIAPSDVGASVIEIDTTVVYHAVDNGCGGKTLNAYLDLRDSAAGAPGDAGFGAGGAAE